MFYNTPELRLRNAALEIIIDSMAHLPKERALEIVLAWFSNDDLIRIGPTITSLRDKFVPMVQELADQKET